MNLQVATDLVKDPLNINSFMAIAIIMDMMIEIHFVACTEEVTAQPQEFFGHYLLTT